MEQIMCDLGYRNIGFPCLVCSNKILGFVITLLSMIKVCFKLRSGDILIIQYPLKKYYTLLCNIVHYRGAKVITLIHDLGSFRRKRLTVLQEIDRLQNSDYLITLNDSMSAWLQTKGCEVPKGELKIWDYLSPAIVLNKIEPATDYTVVYAGALGYNKNRFLYELDRLPRQWHLSVYGKGLEADKILNKEYFSYNGFLPADQLISSVQGDFGLVWDGDSYEACTGNYGEYLRYNNPHKVSLYVRCHLPLIIWEKAALAPFIKEKEIGICINSLEELDGKLEKLTVDDYFKMKSRVIEISNLLSVGYFLIVKRFKRPNIINQIVYSFFRRSKARRSFDYSLEVQKRGFGVADPIAYIEIKHGGLLTDSYYISLYMERMEELREYMAVYRAEDRELRLAFARFTAQLHKAEILHVDYSPGNILVKKQAGSYVFALVDVNRMKFKSISVVDACKNLARLATSRKVLDEVACEYASQRGWDSLEIMRLMGEYSDRFFKNYAFRLGNKAWRRNGGSCFALPSFFYKAYDLLSCCKLLPETTRNVYHHKRIWVYDDYLRPFDFRKVFPESLQD